MNYIISKASRTLYAIRPILKRVSGLDIKIKLLCYKQLIRPVIAYGFAAWSQISSHQMERLRVLERKCLRLCINFVKARQSFRYISNAKLYEEANIERIDSHMCKQALRVFEKWPDSNYFESCINHDIIQLDDAHTPYKPPWYIQHLDNTNRLFVDNTPVFFHRRYRTSNGNLNTVYNIAV